MIPARQGELFGSDTKHVPRHVISYGFGVDSTAIILRWLVDPSSRDFDLSDLVVISALTNDEFGSTIRDVEAAVLPRLAAAGVRYVQVGRDRRTTTAAGEGITVFDDSTTPARILQGRGYALSTELLTAATLPQLASRRCSARAKGAALDPVIARLTAGRPYRHYLGFEVDELRRAHRDATFNNQRRQGVYPLIQWGWSRRDATDFIAQTTGVTNWEKSACTFCPFQFGSRAGLTAALQRYQREPAAGAAALYMESVSLAFNERIGLLAHGRLLDAVRQAGLADVLRLHQERIDGAEHGLYEVQRVARPRAHTTPLVARRVRRLDRGTPAVMRAALATLTGEVVEATDRAPRVVRRPRGEQAPWAEHFYVVAPTAEVADKSRPGFDAMFDAVVRGDLVLL